jgi:hypothetical protein
MVPSAMVIGPAAAAFHLGVSANRTLPPSYDPVRWAPPPNIELDLTALPVASSCDLLRKNQDPPAIARSAMGMMRNFSLRVREDDRGFFFPATGSWFFPAITGAAPCSADGESPASGAPQSAQNRSSCRTAALQPGQWIAFGSVIFQLSISIRRNGHRAGNNQGC